MGIAVVLLMGALQSCSLFDDSKASGKNSEIEFIISEWQETKGSIITSSTIEDLGLFGYLYTAPWVTHNRPDFIYNDQLTKATGWTTPYFYPNDGRYVRFYAYSPYDCPGLDITPSTPSENGVISFTYTVPSNVMDQKDLMLAHTEEILGKGASGEIPLTFHHTLAAIRFKTDTNVKTGTIKSISIKGVYNEGILEYGDTPMAKPVWSLQEGTADFYINDMNKVIVGGVAQEITDDTQTFLMLPQILPTDAKLEIIFNDGSSDYTLTKAISGLTWAQGEITTYVISTESLL